MLPQEQPTLLGMYALVEQCQLNEIQLEGLCSRQQSDYSTGTAEIVPVMMAFCQYSVPVMTAFCQYSVPVMLAFCQYSMHCVSSTSTTV